MISSLFLNKIKIESISTPFFYNIFLLIKKNHFCCGIKNTPIQFHIKNLYIREYQFYFLLLYTLITFNKKKINASTICVMFTSE